MSAIRDWLEAIGLAQYADAFESNDLDLDLLAQVDDQMLKDIGVASAGHRLRIRQAIAQLAPAPPAQAAASRPAPATDRPAPAAERRQLTVLFCDLVGSTALSRALDPEPLREVLGAYQRACREVIERYAGHVAQYLGDGVMGYFGWPRAHEDDAERAVRAALGLLAAVKTVPAPQPLRVRIGIATGPVVVGDPSAEDAASPTLAVGDTPNLAARLQALAHPDEVVIALSTQRLMGTAFEMRDLGAQHLKGLGEPMHAWQVLGEAAVEGRFEASHGVALTPLVGRDSELTLLLDRWHQAADGEGQAVLLAGEPGIGKSRIVRALRERLASHPHTRLRYQCSPFHTHSALYPVIEQLERAAGFERGDDADQRLDKLEALLRDGDADIEASAPLIAALLSLPTDRYPPLNLSPAKQRALTLEALIGQVLGLARTGPVLMIVEDVHWIDPTFQELLDLTLPRIATARVLLVLTARPEHVPRWGAQAHVTTLTLNRLGGRASRALIAALTGGKALPAVVLDQILAKTDGVPLFVEELTKTVLEASVLREAEDRYELTAPLPPLAIPSTLHDSLMARLDRLGPVKDVAQLAACIGRDFSYGLLAEVSPLPGASLSDALRQLADAELVFARGSPPDATYTFKHALVQEAAYESMLKSRRAEVHGRIAAALEGGFPELAKTQPELLAHHFTQAGLTRPAIGYWHAAGQRATERLAYAEAIAYFQRGIELAGTLAEAPDVAALELRLQIELGYGYVPTKGWTAPESLRAFTRAHALSQQAGDDASLFGALWGLWLFNWMRVECALAQDLAEQCVVLAERTGSSDMLVRAYYGRGLSAHHRGAFGLARTEFERAIGLYEPRRHRALALVYGLDPRAGSLHWLAVTLWNLGFADQALARCAETEAAAGELLHPFTRGFAFTARSLVHLFRGEPEVAQWYADALVALGTEQEYPYWVALGTAWRCAAMIEQGLGSEPELGQLRDAITTLRGLGALEPALRVHPHVVRACLRLGDIGAARSAADEGLALIRRHGLGEHEARLLTLLGDALAAPPAPDLAGAERCYAEALEVAHRQDAKSLELQAATGLARLWQRQGQARRARELLHAVYGWFTEGLETRSLREARALLDELEPVARSG
jgi:class 3 adenylate cyclase/tetratricopeptide (TPR) repeat protein